MPLNNPGEVEKRVIELNAGWYNKVCEAMNLNPASFLLAQGTLGLGAADASGLYQMADIAPPSASVAYFDAGGLRSRSQAYEMLLNALLPETSVSLQQILGPHYADWIEYKKEWIKGPLSAKETLTQALEHWAEVHLEGGLAIKVKAYNLKAANTPLIHALSALTAPSAKQKFSTPGEEIYWLYVYSATPEGAQEAIAGGGSADIKFDSSTMNSALKHTTVEGSASGFYDIFSGGASGEFEQLNAMAAFSDFKIEGKIGAYATLPVKAGTWFNSREVERAFSARNDFTIWDRSANAGNWESYFAPPEGALTRNVSQLVLVSEYTVTVKSNASYSAQQYQKIVAAAKFGVWPFFSASGKATNETDYQQAADGSLTVTHKLPRGDIQIWGVTVAEL
jgi:hypothetical protein